MAKPELSSFHSLDDVVLRRGVVSDLSVVISGMTCDCRLNDRVPGDVLYAVFNGAVDRQKYTIPVFARWNWHALLEAPILALCDPVLHLDPNLRLGWFIGTEEVDVTRAMAALVTAVAEQLDIAPGRVICYGSSSGGFAAISVASQMPQGRFVAYNPQVELLRYYKGHLADVSKLFCPSRTVQENAQRFPERWSAIAALRAALGRGYDVRGVIAQNTVDEFHLERHYTPFCEAFELPVEGGSNPGSTLHSTLYEDPRGHGPEPPEVAKRVVEDYVDLLLRP
ncbi:MAG: hypothetical protein H6982_02740 [Chromatiales bacterium]|nr:hypothetical protein [Chromatiales bacterium]